MCSNEDTIVGSIVNPIVWACMITSKEIKFSMKFLMTCTSHIDCET